MDARTLILQKAWVEITDIPQGALMQRVSGAPVHYLYSNDLPKQADIGFPLPGSLTTVLGGTRFFVRSRLLSTISYLPVDVLALNGSGYDDYDYIITDNDIQHKRLILVNDPSRDTVRITPYHGDMQRLDVDYTVTGREVSWDNLALELLLEEGDVVNIRYAKSVG
jgi:hypothetical protein